MLNVLRRIVQEVTAAQDLVQALDIIVQRVKQAMDVDVCSVYLIDSKRNQHILMATDGLNPESVGRVRLDLQRGLIGLVAEREETVNLADAPAHPRYQYFPETGEERYHSFLGVPIIHHRQRLGVLVVQRHASAAFDEDNVTFLITIAAQLAGAIAHAEAVGGVGVLHARRARSHDGQLLGQPGSPGVAEGIAVVAYPSADLDAIPDKQVDDPEKEVAVFRQAVEGVREDIKALMDRMQEVLPTEDRALFDAYLMMLDSESLVGSTIKRIRNGNWASGALRDTIGEHVRLFNDMEDSYLRERGEDVRDLGRRILQRLQNSGGGGKRIYPQNAILVGEEISAAMLAELAPENLVGVVSVRGSRTSHVAILARAMGIPAVMGASDLPVGRMDGRMLVIDGYQGQIFVEPGQAVLQEFRRLAREEQELSNELAGLRELPAETPDGTRVPLFVNSGLLADLSPSRQTGAEGIGLYRTEFPYMLRDRFPGEDEQTRIYRQVLESYAPAPVTLRTLDVGGDKALPYFPIEEDNPFLGWRGIRITLDHPEIFLVQLRAMMRASADLDNLYMLLPMISGVGELEEALVLVHRAYNELREDGIPISMPRIGVMIEVPSAVYQVENLARRVDFISIGTNDLTQYLLAVDRNNARVASLYDSLHPAVLQSIYQVVKGSHAVGTSVSVCGEMAGDPAAAILLLGMGVDCLSMSVSNIPRIKWVVRSFTLSKAKRLLNKALKQEYAEATRHMLNRELEKAGLGGLVRAGR